MWSSTLTFANSSTFPSSPDIRGGEVVSGSISSSSILTSLTSGHSFSSEGSTSSSGGGDFLLISNPTIHTKSYVNCEIGT
jgi:hypothetical protein